MSAACKPYVMCRIANYDERARRARSSDWPLNSSHKLGRVLPTRTVGGAQHPSNIIRNHYKNDLIFIFNDIIIIFLPNKYQNVFMYFTFYLITRWSSEQRPWHKRHNCLVRFLVRTSVYVISKHVCSFGCHCSNLFLYLLCRYVLESSAKKV